MRCTARRIVLPNGAIRANTTGELVQETITCRDDCIIICDDSFSNVQI